MYKQQESTTSKQEFHYPYDNEENHDMLERIEQRIEVLNSHLNRASSRQVDEVDQLTKPSPPSNSTDISVNMIHVPRLNLPVNNDNSSNKRKNSMLSSRSDQESHISRLLTPTSQCKPNIHSLLKCMTLSPTDNNTDNDDNTTISLDLASHNVTEVLVASSLAEALPSSYMQLSNITVLSLRENNLTVDSLTSFKFLPSTCPYIQSIDLGRNHLAGNFPIAWIGTELKQQIISLDLSYNALTDVKSLVLLENLQYLNLSHNKLCCLVVFPTKQLISLDLSHNLINNMINFRIIGMCKEVRVLSLLGNPICSLSTSAAAKKQGNYLKVAAYSLFPKLEQFNEKLLAKQVLKQIEVSKTAMKGNVKTQQLMPSSYPLSQQQQECQDRNRVERGEVRRQIILQAEEQCHKQLDQHAHSSIKKLSQEQVRHATNRLYKTKTDCMKSSSSASKVITPAEKDRRYPNLLTQRMRDLLPKRSTTQSYEKIEVDPVEVDSSIESFQQMFAYGVNTLVLACKLAAYDEFHMAAHNVDDIKALRAAFEVSLADAPLHPSLDLSPAIQHVLNSVDEEHHQYLELKRRYQHLTSISTIIHGLKAVILRQPSSTISPSHAVRLKSYVEMLLQTQAGRDVTEHIIPPMHINLQELLDARMTKMQIMVNQWMNDIDPVHASNEIPSHDNDHQLDKMVSGVDEAICHDNNDIEINSKIMIEDKDQDEYTTPVNVYKRKDDDSDYQCKSPPKRHKSMEDVLRYDMNDTPRTHDPTVDTDAAIEDKKQDIAIQDHAGCHTSGGTGMSARDRILARMRTMQSTS